MNYSPSLVESSSFATLNATPSPFSPFATLPLACSPVLLSAAQVARLSFLLAYTAPFVALEADPISDGHTFLLGERFTDEAAHLAEMLRANERP